MSKPNLEPLIGIYLTVKDSLEFAEKKNAIITAFISSIIFAVFRYASDTNPQWLSVEQIRAIVAPFEKDN